MAKALLDLTTLSSCLQPLHGLVRWLRGTSSGNASGRPAAWSRWPDCPAHGRGASDTSTASHRPSDGPPVATAHGSAEPDAAASVALPATASAALHTSTAERPARSPAGSQRTCAARAPGAVRVVQRRQAGTPERFVISGRMADVRAELERWAAAEAVLQ